MKTKIPTYGCATVELDLTEGMIVYPYNGTLVIKRLSPRMLDFVIKFLDSRKFSQYAPPPERNDLVLQGNASGMQKEKPHGWLPNNRTARA